MSEPRAIDGDYANFALVKTRGVCQVIVEFPIEHAEKVTRLLGFPHHGKIKRVAVALLNEPGPTTQLDTGPAEGGAATTERNAAPPSPKPNSTRAVMMAKDARVQRYLTELAGYSVDAESKADVAIKKLCGVRSKSDLNTGDGAVAFSNFRQNFGAWLRLTEARH